MKTINLTVAQAISKFFTNQFVSNVNKDTRFIAGVFMNFDMDKDTEIEKAFFDCQNEMKIHQAVNPASVGYIASAFSKATQNRRIIISICSHGFATTSLLPSIVQAYYKRTSFITIISDAELHSKYHPVRDQLESHSNLSFSVSDLFQPVSELFAKIHAPEQLLYILPRCLNVLSEFHTSGPVILSIPEDVQKITYDFPESLFQSYDIRPKQPEPDQADFKKAVRYISKSKKPVLLIGGGIHQADALNELRKFSEIHEVPVVETISGKSALPWKHRNYLGGIGADGAESANKVYQESDLVISIGTRFTDYQNLEKTIGQHQDFTHIQINTSHYDAFKNNALPIIGDAKVVLPKLSRLLREWKSSRTWQDFKKKEVEAWNESVQEITAQTQKRLPSESEIIGVLNSITNASDTIVCSYNQIAKKIYQYWKPNRAKGYQMHYGFEAPGSEIAFGIGFKLAVPERDVIVMTESKSFLTMSHEIILSLSLHKKIIILIIDDNHSKKSFESLTKNSKQEQSLKDIKYQPLKENIDYVQHAKSLGAQADMASNITELDEIFKVARKSRITYVIQVKTFPMH